MNSHRGIVNRLLWMQERYGLRPEDRVLQKTPFSFDVSVWEFFWPLLVGARLVMARPGGHQDPAYLVETIAGEGITTLHFVPSMLQVFVEAPGVERCASLQRVIASGEALPPDLVARFFARLPGVELHNLYGPTEAAVDVTHHACSPESSRRGVPIGRPVANTAIHLLDRALQPVPVGVPGELFIGGIQVGRGYLGRPEMTAERFVPDPFSPENNARLYRTGDLARHLPDGAVDYLGRLDHQVKVRGFRIELGEIESALAAFPEVREAVVLALERENDRRLVAFVVGPAPEDTRWQETARAALGRRLPEYMVPASFVLLPELPLSPNGKVDRRALAALGGDAWRAAPRREWVAPRTPLEELVAGALADLLGAERVGALDDFFALGGHSLLAARLVGRLRDALGVDLPLRRVFETPTVAALAADLEARLAAGESAAGAAAPPPIPPLPRPAAGPAEFPLSFAQERLWFLDQLEPGSPGYNLPAAVRARGRLDVAALARSLGEIVRRHEALRTVFAARDSGPVQVILPAGEGRWALPFVDLRGLPKACGEQEAERLASEEAARPFDLATGPLLRAQLLQVRGVGSEIPSSEADHVLLVTMHHVVSDGWSTGVFLRELAGFYAAPAASPLPELPVQYADYAVWQRGWLAGDVLERQLAWWRERLAGAPQALDLPADRPRPPVRSGRGGQVSARLPEELAGALAALSRRRGATLFMTLLAGWAALLRRLSGQPDVVVGSPVAGRVRPEIEGLIGFFVNTLAMRIDAPAGDPDAERFAALLARVRETALGAYSHQDLPFERLVEALQPARDPSRTPLFQVLLVFQNAPAAPFALPGVELAPLPQRSRSAKFDLTLAVAERAGALAADLEYSRDLFDAATAERFLRQLGTLLAAAAADPAHAVGELPLLDAAERRQLLVEWAGAAPSYPRERCVHELFEEQARRRPEAVALAWDGDGASGHLSYGALEARANRLARCLRRLGVGTDTRVGVCLERSPALIVALLAILKAGGAYLPLDPDYPAERLAMMLDDGEVPLLVTVERLLESLPPAAAGRRMLLLDRDAAAVAAERPLPPPSRAFPESLAYVLFTSGSTGRPKGVAVPHRGIVRLVTQDAFLRYSEDEVFLELGPLPFDLSTFEIWGPLANGSRLVLFPPGPLSLEELAAALARHGVTTLWLTAGLFHQMVEEHLPALLEVKQLLAGGDVLSVPHVERVLAGLPPGAVLVDGYGPTENTTFTTCHVMEAGSSVGATVPIGRPIHNGRVVLLDRDLRPVPVGVPAELYAGGDGLARCYLGRPDATAERYLPDPLPREDGGTAGGRLYSTGDLARWLADGTLEFLGRLDQQVKIRGFRIEPGEIETALCAHPAVRDAVVLPIDRTRREGFRALADSAGGKVLVAYVVSSSGAAGGTLPDLAAFLRRRLPEHMVPSFFVPLPELPLNPNGKVDRRALAAIDPPRRESGAGRAGGAPRNPAEELLAGVWAEVLGLPRVAVDEDFFALGGHSLLATRLVARLRSRLGLPVPVALLFRHPTVAGLAAALAESPEGEPEAPLDARPRSPEGDDETSFSQQRLWFLDRLEPGSALYNVPAAFHASGPLDVAAWAAALDEVVRRHEALRTVFPAVDGRPVQRVLPPAPPPVPVADLAALPRARRRGEAIRLVEAEARRPFDLAAGPLFRALLVRLGRSFDADGGHFVVLNQHHVVCDGWSIGILLRELAALYRAFAARRKHPTRAAALAAAALPPLPVQYADFARWQRRRLGGATVARRLAWWRERLAGLPALELPADRPRPPVQTFRGRAATRTLPPGLGREVAAAGRRRGATLFMTLLAGFQTLLGRVSGQDDFAVGSPVANRERREVEGLVGFFVDTVALRADLAGDPTFEELLARVRETTLLALAHQDVPFDRLVEELAPERDLARPPLFQVGFALQERQPVPHLPGLRVEPLEIAKRDAKFDLGMAAVETEDGLAVGLAWNVDLFDAVRIERMLAHFAALLAGASAAPGRRLSELPLLSAAERQQLLVEWNAAPAGAGGEAVSPPALFAAQAARTPDAVALVCAGEALTYGALREESALLARRLRALGVGPEVRVGICLERSFRMVASLLGVLEAGGVYVPLDPTYPRERLGFMVEDSGAAVVLTEAGRREALPPHRAVEVLLDAPAGANAFAPGAATRAAAAHPTPAAAAAYVIYTSGSTGVPKGVVVSRRAMANLLADRRSVLSARDRVLHKTPISFDASIFEVFSPLVAGGCAVLARPGGQQDAAYLVRLIAEEGITVAGSPPALLAALVEQPALSACRSLRRMAAGGEALAHEVAERFLALGLCDLWNVYGPTETTVAVLEWRCRGREPGGVVPVGRPIAGARVVLLDRHGNPVPAGVPGELYAGGPVVARGYLHRPDATAERYLPDPFSGEPGARLYRTGDLARVRGDGAVEFVGRADGQVKVRGFRVELGEVEVALGGLAGVQAAAVVAVTERAGGGNGSGRPAAPPRRLVAFFVPAPGAAPPSADDLRAALAERLPEFMVPSAFVALPALPLGPSGKVDRAALALLEPTAAGEAARRGRVHVPPRDSLELRLAAAWEEVLGVERVGVRDGFFELGGHSLLAVRLMGRVARLAGRELPLATLFQAPTVEQMASLLRDGVASGAWSPLVPLRVPGATTGAGRRAPIDHVEAPFFCVHPIGGSVFCYRDLAQRLGADHAFYGLEARGLVAAQEPRGSIPAMAADYLAAVRETQPHGPYRLGGWSFGGLVALEMARQLEEHGEQVALLALIDPATPAAASPGGPAEELAADDPAALRFLARDLAGLSGRPFEVDLEELERLPPGERLGHVLERAITAEALPPDVSSTQVLRLVQLHLAHAGAAAAWTAPVCAAPVTVFLGSESPARGGLESWRRVAAGGLEVVEVPGDHYALLREPRVEALAAALHDRLERTRAEIHAEGGAVAAESVPDLLERRV